MAEKPWNINSTREFSAGNWESSPFRFFAAILFLQSKMSLSEEHTASIVEYLRFMRYKRSQRVRGVDANFQELKDSRWDCI